MPRSARLYLPGAVHHIIARFVNRDFLLRGAPERAAYLKRLGREFSRNDWRLLAYALMSNHIHLAAVAGWQAVGRVVQPMHTSFAGWLNKAQGRLGPVFAGRFHTVICDGRHAAHLIAYLHNNPVRAGLVTRADESDWTSHRAYLGLATRPRQLRCDQGLRLCGFPDTADGRGGFGGFVDERAGATRDSLLSGEQMAGHRRELRKRVGAPIKISDPVLSEGKAIHELWTGAGAPDRSRWNGDPTLVLALVADAIEVDVAELQSTGRARELVRGRRLALMIWRRLNRPVVEMSQALGVSNGAASHLTRRGRPRVAALDGLAERITARCRAIAIGAPKVKK